MNHRTLWASNHPGQYSSDSSSSSSPPRSCLLPRTRCQSIQIGLKPVTQLLQYATFYCLSNIQSVFAILSIVYFLICGMRDHPTHPHQIVTGILDFINWGMFLAVWIALAQQISSDNSYCTAPDGGHLHTKPCNTIYSACALAVVNWILFTISFGSVLYAIVSKEHIITRKT